MANQSDVRLATVHRDRACALAAKRGYPAKRGAPHLITDLIQREYDMDLVGLGPADFEEAIRDLTEKRRAGAAGGLDVRG